MEVYCQTCQSCGSNQVRNHLVIEPGEPDKIFVQCTNCQDFVARYVLSPGGYYHHQKGFDSFLKSLSRTGYTMSGKRLKREFEENKKIAETKFVRMLEFIQENKEEECP